MGSLTGLHDFEADGLLAPRDPAGKHSPSAFVMVTIEGGQWKRIYPDSGFAEQ
jgi:hypothetical protein